MIRDLSDLEIAIICCRVRARASSEESGEFSALLSVKDPNTGETGHYAYIVEWYERDVEFERLMTDRDAFVCESDIESPLVFGWSGYENTGVEPINHPAWTQCTIHAYGDK